MNSKKLWQIIALVVVVAVLIFGLPAILNKNSDNKSPEDNQQSQTNSNLQYENISLTIESLYQGKRVSIAADQTVLQVLLTLDNSDPQMRLLTKEYSGLGTLVESLGGITNGTDGKYWQYKVNNIMPQIGADQYKLKAGDKVEWYFAKPDSPTN